MKPESLKLLLTSVGSFVGSNILDSLSGRRENVWVVGTNSLAEACNNFRCDEVYLVPPAQDALSFKKSLKDIIDRIQPDLILPCRDDDIGILAELKEEHPEWSDRFPVGCPEVARMMDDKWLSYCFAKEKGIPFVDTAKGSREDLSALLENHGFPLIAKPIYGNGSKGVLVLFDENQLWRCADREDLVFQPYICPPQDLKNIFDEICFGMPLFYAPPILDQISIMLIIDPQGRVQGCFCGDHVMRAGQSERVTRLEDAGLNRMAREIGVRFAESGWRGSLNIQGRMAESGEFMPFEFNGRVNGGTFARLLLGFDELGLLARHFAGEGLLRPGPLPVEGEVHLVSSYERVKLQDSAALSAQQRWPSGA